jgi:hypothetical protein
MMLCLRCNATGPRITSRRSVPSPHPATRDPVLRRTHMSTYAFAPFPSPLGPRQPATAPTLPLHIASRRACCSYVSRLNLTPLGAPGSTLLLGPTVGDATSPFSASAYARVYFLLRHLPAPTSPHALYPVLGPSLWSRRRPPDQHELRRAHHHPQHGQVRGVPAPPASLRRPGAPPLLTTRRCVPGSGPGPHVPGSPPQPGSSWPTKLFSRSRSRSLLREICVCVRLSYSCLSSLHGRGGWWW